jgi:hypothetical protein
LSKSVRLWTSLGVQKVCARSPLEHTLNILAKVAVVIEQQALPVH